MMALKAFPPLPSVLFPSQFFWLIFNKHIVMAAT